MEIANRGLDLEKELACSICTEILHDPLTLLDCLHTFCGACLKDWFGFQLNSARNNPNSSTTTTPYTCPSCRALVRATKHDARVNTLLSMFLGVNPEKGKTEEEKAESRKKYTPGDVLMPNVEEREMSLRERRVEDEDRRLMNQVRDISLRDVDGTDSNSSRRERRRREEVRMRSTAPRSSRDNSRHSRNSEVREQRRHDSDGDRIQPVTSSLRPGTESSTDRRRRRSQDDAQRRHEETSRRAARQVEHQSSLRSLISSDDGESQDMQEEIFRQIQEEGLLDGVDIDNITDEQQVQIRQRIAEAYLRRQREHAHSASPRATVSHSPRARPPISDSGSANSSNRLRLRASSNSSSRQRPHSRSTSLTNEAERVRGGSSSQELSSSDDGQRRLPTSSRIRRSTSPNPQAVEIARPEIRAHSDLSERPRSSQTPPRPSAAQDLQRNVIDSTSSRSLESLPLMPAPPNRTAPIPPTSDELILTSDIVQTPVELAAEGISPLLPTETMVTASSTSAHTASPVTDQRAVFLEPELVPTPLTPRHSPSLSDRATAMGSVARPLSSSNSSAHRVRTQFYPEPSLTCARCEKPHIEYELHYNCLHCFNGEWNVCLDCYRRGRGCLHWFGFGATAWAKWESKIMSGELSRKAERPHMLFAERYLPPKMPEGGADGRRTLTPDDPEKRLQSGCFCSSCLAWANECYWKCDSCNDDDWGFCNNCVNQGKCCTHPLLPLVCRPDKAANATTISPELDQQTPSTASIITGPDVASIGPFKPLTFRVSCDVCSHAIPPPAPRYHCFECTSTSTPGCHRGDYDICTACYANLTTRKRISAENGAHGWRRCLKGHRMIVAGFVDARGVQRRIVLRDLVGGRGLREEPSNMPGHLTANIYQWSWAEGTQLRYVMGDVSATAPAAVSTVFPPDGGVGMKAVAAYSWYPQQDAEDELAFPRRAELVEVINVNDDWYFGSYMGHRGLFPAPYVRITDRGS